MLCDTTSDIFSVSALCVRRCRCHWINFSQSPRRQSTKEKKNAEVTHKMCSNWFSALWDFVLRFVAKSLVVFNNDSKIAVENVKCKALQNDFASSRFSNVCFESEKLYFTLCFVCSMKLSRDFNKKGAERTTWSLIIAQLIRWFDLRGGKGLGVVLKLSHAWRFWFEFWGIFDWVDGRLCCVVESTCCGMSESYVTFQLVQS